MRQLWLYTTGENKGKKDLLLYVFLVYKGDSILFKKQRTRGHHEKIYLKKRRLEYDEQEKARSAGVIRCDGHKYNVNPRICRGFLRWVR